MAAEETTEQRRARLQGLAKQRVAALINGYNVLPHRAAGRNRSALKEGLLATRRLLETGSAEFKIDEHTIQVSESVEFRQPPDRIFLVSVDGVPIDVQLLRHSGSIDPCFTVLLSAEARSGLGSNVEKVTGDSQESNIYSLFYHALIGDSDGKPLSRYINELRAKKAELQAKEAERQQFERERNERIVNEAIRFRNVLVRKHRQLVFTDEYEIRDDSRFVEELKKFASRRLPDVAAPVVVELVGELVQKWAEEHADSDKGRGFCPNMSPLDYERYCSALFGLAGWRARLTNFSGDQGADIVCDGDGIRLVVQCKLYGTSVGNGAVQEVIAAREFEFADAAVVVSNATFTRSARDLANVAKVLLLHHEQISSLSPDVLRSELRKKTVRELD